MPNFRLKHSNQTFDCASRRQRNSLGPQVVPPSNLRPCCVEERQATRELVLEGLRKVESGAPSISADDVQDWFLADDDGPFPTARKIP